MSTDRPRLLAEDTGASAVEYALLASLIAAVIVVIVATLGQQVLELFNGVIDSF